MIDMFRKMNIKNMMIKSHNHNNFLMIALNMKMNTFVNIIAKFANTCYTSPTIIYMIRIISLII